MRGDASWGVGSDQFMSDADRVAEMERVVAQLHHVIKQFPRTRVLEFAILKSHLITESALTHFIRLTSRVLVSAEEIKLSYAQKLQIAQLHGFAYGSATVIPSLEILNGLRNHVVHKFEFDMRLVDLFVKINSDAYDESLDATNIGRIRCLRQFSKFLAASTAGTLESLVYMTAKNTSDAL
jgi:hypothetical protein